MVTFVQFTDSDGFRQAVNPAEVAAVSDARRLTDPPGTWPRAKIHMRNGSEFVLDQDQEEVLRTLTRQS